MDAGIHSTLMMWIELALALCRAAISLSTEMRTTLLGNRNIGPGLTALGYTPCHSEVPILSVHVVCSTPGVVPQPYSNVLNLCWVFVSELENVTQVYVKTNG